VQKTKHKTTLFNNLFSFVSVSNTVHVFLHVAISSFLPNVRVNPSLKILANPFVSETQLENCTFLWHSRLLLVRRPSRVEFLQHNHSTSFYVCGMFQAFSISDQESTAADPGYKMHSYWNTFPYCSSSGTQNFPCF